MYNQLLNDSRVSICDWNSVICILTSITLYFWSSRGKSNSKLDCRSFVSFDWSNMLFLFVSKLANKDKLELFEFKSIRYSFIRCCRSFRRSVMRWYSKVKNFMFCSFKSGGNSFQKKEKKYSIQNVVYVRLKS